MIISEVRTFCGLTSYNRAFVEEFARVARPLHNLTRKNIPFEWDEDSEAAFLELKKRLTTTPILVAPCDEGTYVLDTDTSDTAFGAMLQQKQDGQLHVIGYATVLCHMWKDTMRHAQGTLGCGVWTQEVSAASVGATHHRLHRPCCL